jgi:hypothetical protein
VAMAADMRANQQYGQQQYVDNTSHYYAPAPAVSVSYTTYSRPQRTGGSSATTYSGRGRPRKSDYTRTGNIRR